MNTCRLVEWWRLWRHYTIQLCIPTPHLIPSLLLMNTLTTASSTRLRPKWCAATCANFWRNSALLLLHLGSPFLLLSVFEALSLLTCNHGSWLKLVSGFFTRLHSLSAIWHSSCWLIRHVRWQIRSAWRPSRATVGECQKTTRSAWNRSWTRAQDKCKIPSTCISVCSVLRDQMREVVNNITNVFNDIMWHLFRMEWWQREYSRGYPTHWWSLIVRPRTTLQTSSLASSLATMKRTTTSIGPPTRSNKIQWTKEGRTRTFPSPLLCNCWSFCTKNLSSAPNLHTHCWLRAAFYQQLCNRIFK